MDPHPALFSSSSPLDMEVHGIVALEMWIPALQDHQPWQWQTTSTGLSSTGSPLQCSSSHIGSREMYGIGRCRCEKEAETCPMKVESPLYPLQQAVLTLSWWDRVPPHFSLSRLPTLQVSLSIPSLLSYMAAISRSERRNHLPMA